MAALMRGEQNAAAAIVDGVQVLTLPFRGHLMAMTFLMPIDGTLNELESELTAERWHELLSPRVDELRMVTLPKFKFETSIPDMGDYFATQATRVLFEKPTIDRSLRMNPWRSLRSCIRALSRSMKPVVKRLLPLQSP